MDLYYYLFHRSLIYLAFGISESVKDNFHVVEEPLVHSVGEVVWY